MIHHVDTTDHAGTVALCGGPYSKFAAGGNAPRPELVRLDYDATPVATAMRAEGLPAGFAQSLEQGIWTACAAILPPARRNVTARYPTPSITTYGPFTPCTRRSPC